jgi:hypothetical protein
MPLKVNTFPSPATYQYPVPNGVLSVTEQGTRRHKTSTKFFEFVWRGRKCDRRGKSPSYVSSPLNQNSDSFYFTQHDKCFLNYNELEVPGLVLNSVKVVMRLLVIGKSSSGRVLFGFLGRAIKATCVNSADSYRIRGFSSISVLR